MERALLDMEFSFKQFTSFMNSYRLFILFVLENGILYFVHINFNYIYFIRISLLLCFVIEERKYISKLNNRIVNEAVLCIMVLLLFK